MDTVQCKYCGDVVTLTNIARHNTRKHQAEVAAEEAANRKSQPTILQSFFQPSKKISAPDTPSCSSPPCADEVEFCGPSDNPECSKDLSRTSAPGTSTGSLATTLFGTIHTVCTASIRQLVVPKLDQITQALENLGENVADRVRLRVFPL